MLTAGTNISFVYDDANNTLTINASSVGGYDLSANDTDDLSEGTSNLYFTNERVDDRVDTLLIAGTGISKTYNDSANSLTLNLDFTEFNTSNITENTNLYFTGARARAAISVSGDLGYDSSTGIISFSERTDSTIRGLVSATDSGGDGSFAYNSTTGVFTYTGPSASEVRAHFSAGTGVSITTGEIAIGQSVGTGDSVSFDSISVGGGYTASTGTGTTLDTDGNVSMNGNLVVEGNLTVSGTTTTINTETITLDDNIIVLNNNKSGAPGTETAGIEVERGSGTNVQLRWNDATDVWEFTTDGTTFETIATTGDVSAAAENDYVNSASFATGTGVLTLTRLSGTDVTVDLDGRFLTSTITSDVLPDATANNRNLGSSGAKFNTVYATTFEGTATSAQYADLAEIYDSDILYPTGTAVCVGGDQEVTACDKSKMCIGVISADPAFLMNKDADGQAVALKGRVPVRVKGPVQKGQAVYAWEDGYCTTMQTTALVGIALESSDVNTEKLIECVLKV